MRGTVAKRLRRDIYGGVSARIKEYADGGTGTATPTKHETPNPVKRTDGTIAPPIVRWEKHGTVACVGLRRVYKDAKVAHVRRAKQ